MPFTFVDRVPSKLGRVKITPENGGTPYYAVVERADEPATAGTPLSAANLNAAQESLVYRNDSSLSTWRSVYVAPNGNDNNAGTESSPMKTIKGAIRKYAKWHKYMDIFLQAGTYTEDIGQIATDQCSLTLRGVTDNKDAVTINITSMVECHITLLRLIDLTLNVTTNDARGVSVYAGMLYANNIRINLPTSSAENCVSVYNGASAFLINCVLNPGTGAAVYGTYSLEIRATGCTSEKTIQRGFVATYGSVITYTPTLTATTMTVETTGGKCIPLTARSGSVNGSVKSLSGQYATFDGLLIQWGTVTISPTAVNTPTGAMVTFPIPFSGTPTVFATPITLTPETVSVGIVRNGEFAPDPKLNVGVILTRNNGTTSTGINWVAIGPA